MKKKQPGPMIPLEEALRIVLDGTACLPSSEVSLFLALGGVLAEDIPTDRDYPPFRKSAMDGFAVLSRDTESPPRTLSVIEEIPAGASPTRPVGPGEASAIMTGAPVPEGADAVIPVERTDPRGDDEVVVQARVLPGENICQQGEDSKEGEIVLSRGTPIRPEEMAVLAALGRDGVPIYGKPTVAIISTGDELVEVGARPGPHQIRNSNGHALWAQCRNLGLPAHLLGIAPDREDPIREKILEALEDDVVLISGGVSMGEYDLVGGVLERLGFRPAFERVSVKPGKPTVFGTLREKPVFGLPGNPVSGFVIFHLLVRPVLLKMMGLHRPRWEEVEAILEEGELKSTKRWQFLPGVLRKAGRDWKVRLAPWRGSGDLFGPSRGNCLVQVPIGSPPLRAGDPVRVIPMNAPVAGL